MSNRKHLTPSEVERLLEVTLHGKNPERDYCLIYMCFIHGCRASEIGDGVCRISIWKAVISMCIGWKMVFPPCIRFICAKDNVCGAGWINVSGTAGPIRSGCFFPIAAAACRVNVFTGWFAITARWLNWRSMRTRTCCGMAADLHWRIAVSTPV